MQNRIIDFLLTQSREVWTLKKTERLFRFGIFVVALILPTIICGMITSFTIVWQMWILLLAVFIPLIGGIYFIYRYFWQNQKLSFLLSAILIGFVFFVGSLIGMSIDPKSANLSLQYKLSTSFVIWIVVSLVSAIGSLFYSSIVRRLRE